MKRNLIIIGGGLLQIPLIETAKSMGLHTIVFDMSKEAAGMKAADEIVVMSTKDTEGCVREAKKLKLLKDIHGVITAGTDASKAVSAIAAALDLPGIRYADAEAATNKVLMRKRLRSHNVPVPNFFSVWSLKEARDAMDELEFPLVLKPAENMGARGVIKIESREEIQAAYKHSRRYSPTGEMILEEYMEGPELSVDALAYHNNITITGIADRIITREPYFIEIGHNMPSAMSEEILKETERVMKLGMQALGIHTGAGKGDIKITKKGIMVGEIAARLSGGFMSSHTFPYHSGISLHAAAIRIALGDDPGSLIPETNLVAIERGLLSRPGKILSMNGREKMEAIPGVRNVFFTKQVGDIMPEITSNIDKCGHVIVVAETLAEAEQIADKALSHFYIVTDESFSIDWKIVEERARLRFGDRICHVCKSCDGTNCASGVPGMGGTGNMLTFQDNAKALAEYTILPRYIREHVRADTSLEIFGRKIEMPVMTAPMTGAVTNLNGAIGEYELAKILLQSCRESGSLAWIGDGASPEKWDIVKKALKEVDGFGVVIFKPRADTSELIRRMQEACDMGAVAVGMDIDAISFKTMELRNIPGLARDSSAISYIRDQIKAPFVLKGIMSVSDAKEAVKSGVDAIVVSNHGGRVLDQLPGTARVLPEIAASVDKVHVLVDGGIRSGQDVFKMLALGATSVLIGRPSAIAAVGGENAGVKYILKRYEDELVKTMNLCGTSRLQEITGDYLFRIETEKNKTS